MSHSRIARYIRVSQIALASLLMLAASACSTLNKKYAGANDGDFVNGTPLPDRQDGVSFMGDNVDRSRFTPVYFAFDSHTINSSETGKLDEVVEFMKSSSKQLVIAGFTDERGTAEYNRGLGERRAQAVRSYLLEHGADTNRIQTTSFGAEMPADPGHDDAAYAKNRRAEFGVTK